ncbi:P-loop containing nucleoside triphosphate hydrolase protein [Mycena polygramma]|nr:P-loop containing nucleoside triphosphate hydrolase protein [Mycena polygramma]KAJ7663150.1 P-loop containing nucleoside triphosphate hydrolase protein [Mycena polygramma]
MVSPAWHYVLKFIITGDAAVGKSSLLVRLTDQRFLANPDPTLGVEFGSKLITLPGPEATVVKLQCWDTAGTESFRSITRSYYRGAAGCLLVYDVTSRRSFDNVRTWLADVRAHADAHVSCILVGNKVDLCEGEGALVSWSLVTFFFFLSERGARGGGEGGEE